MAEKGIGWKSNSMTHVPFIGIGKKMQVYTNLLWLTLNFRTRKSHTKIISFLFKISGLGENFFLLGFTYLCFLILSMGRYRFFIGAG